MELELIPAKIGYGTMKIYTKGKINLSVDRRPPKRKDMQLLNYLEDVCPSSLEVKYQLTH